MNAIIQAKFAGSADILRKLEGLRQGTRNRITRPALNLAGKIIRDAAKATVPVRKSKRGTKGKPGRFGAIRYYKGFLRKSLGTITKTYRKGIMVIVGPRNEMGGQIGVVGRGRHKGRPVMEDPAKIAHLVERGHKGKHPAPGKYWMRRAVNTSKNRARNEFIMECRSRFQALGR